MTGMKAKKKFLRWLYRRGPVMRPGMKGLEYIFRLGRIPLVRRLNPWMDAAKNEMSYVPINKSLDTGSTVLPPQIIHEFIDMTPYHVVSETCGCRLAQRCEHFPDTIGCLFMGASAPALSPGTMKTVSREEAHRHVESAISTGLTPVIGKIRVDNFIFLERDRERLLSVCFCCHCCCMMGYFRHIPSRRLNEVMRPIEGLSIRVTDACAGCGACIGYCRFGAITIRDGRAVHNEFCRGCGRCERYCPNGAISITLDNPHFKEDVIRRISTYVDVT